MQYTICTTKKAKDSILIFVVMAVIIISNALGAQEFRR